MGFCTQELFLEAWFDEVLSITGLLRELGSIAELVYHLYDVASVVLCLRDMF